MSLKVKDVMSKEIKSLSPDMNAKDALEYLIKSGMSGLPVIDSDDNLVGVFTEKEVLSAIVPSYVKDVGAFVYGEDSKAELKKLVQLEKFKIKDLMRKEFSTIGEESSLTEASKIMLTKSERRIVVVRGRHPVGIITRCDVVKALADKAGIKL